MRCTSICWTPVPCPEHGEPMTPCGRDAGPEKYPCCDTYMDPQANPRHLWNEHDSTRWYVDQAGWNEHEAVCPICNDLGEE